MHRNRVIPMVLAALLVGSALSPVVLEAQAPRNRAPRAASIHPSTPPDARGRTILGKADAYSGLKILVSTEDRRLWLVNGRDTLMNVPVAIGMAQSFEFEGKKFWFETPRSERRVIGKAPNPLWNVPEWHYMERAKSRGYQLVRLEKSTKYLLSDDTFILTIGDDVGRLNRFGNFWPFTPGAEIMFDDKVFVPPQGTNQRLVPEALGPFKLDTGDGYLIHGTHIYNEDSIGQAVSHGCVRLHNEDLIKLYPLVPVGTPVFVF